jgi:hypothetical protein
MRVKGRTMRQDGVPFKPGRYRLRVTAGETPPPGRRRYETVFDASLSILPLDSPARVRQYHLIEAAFYRGNDGARALKHREALAKLPDTTWLDRLLLGEALGDVGRHHAAVQIFREIMAELSTSATAPLFKKGRYLRLVARSFAAEGDMATATRMLQLEGRVPDHDIPAVVRRLRDTAPRQQ